jgi:hypothetical protein
MTKPVPILACAVVVTLAMSPEVRAALSDEIQVYNDDINAAGEFGLEAHVNTTPKGRTTPDYPGEATPDHGWRVTPEFSYGLSDAWEAGLYLPLARDASGSWTLAGGKLRMKWLPIRPGDGAAGWFAGANLELSRLQARFSESRDSAELRVIGGYHGPDWQVAVNPVFGKDLSAGYRSGAPDFSMQFKGARAIGAGLDAGVEYYSELGTTTRIARWDQQSNTLFLALDAQTRLFNLNFGIGRGISPAADRWTVKAIFGFTL